VRSHAISSGMFVVVRERLHAGHDVGAQQIEQFQYVARTQRTLALIASRL